MDLLWGYAGILSLGHFAFFALGGYMVGMWLMYARTEEIVLAANQGLPMAAQEIQNAIGSQTFGVVGTNKLPAVWTFAGSLPAQLALVARVFGSLCFLWASALALGYLAAVFVVSGKFGSVLRAIRDDEARVRFPGYPVEGYKLFVFTLRAVIAPIALIYGSPSGTGDGSGARRSARLSWRWCRVGSPAGGRRT